MRNRAPLLRYALAACGFLLVMGCGQSSEKVERTEVPARNLLTRPHINTTMSRAFDWQINNFFYEVQLPDGGFQDVSDTGWVRGAFFAGVMAAYEATGHPKYLNAAIEISERNQWQPGARMRHADDLCIAQTYASIFLETGEPRMIASTIERFDRMIAEPRSGPVVGWTEDDNWSWCDALFMAPPTMALVAEATGGRGYLDLMNGMWWETYDYLYDPEEHLWYGDGRFVIQEDGSQPRTTSGNKVFWSRGNGWVFAGLALVLAHMPEDYPERPRYVELFRDMAAALIAVQGENGFWPSSLLDPEEFTIPESSGTGFLTFGLAWGVNNGLLDPEISLPAVHRGWEALNQALRPDGSLGWVQQIGYDPSSVTAHDSMDYGTGAILLAGSEMLKLVAAAED